MTQLIKFAAFFLIVVFVFAGCKKQTNKPPVANAGNDVSVQLLSCGKTAFAELDGSGSYDPENIIVRYYWRLLYGPPGYNLTNSNSAKATVGSLSAGIYGFELTVMDRDGLYSSDIVQVSVNGNSAIPIGYDLDISLNTTFNTLDNYINPWDFDTYYYDATYMRGKGMVPPIGEFDIGVYEYADTAALSDNLYESYLQIITGIPNSQALYIDGELSGINFKKLIRQGGGSFNGTCTVTGGSAIYCDANVFTNLPPLIVAGSLDVTTRIVTLSIKGKVFF